MNAGVTWPTHRHPLNVPRLLLLVAICAWAGFWTWFVVLDGLSDAQTLGPKTYWIMLAILTGLWIPTIASWRRPRVGAVCMVIVGALAWWFFPGAFARSVFAGPPFVFALALIWLAARGRTRSTERG